MQVTSHLGPEQLPNALYNSHLVIIPAGVPRKPGMTRDDLFNINAGKSMNCHAFEVLLACMPAICCADCLRARMNVVYCADCY